MTGVIIQGLWTHVRVCKFTLTLTADRERCTLFLIFISWGLFNVLDVDAVLAHHQLDHGLDFALCLRCLLILFTDLR